MLFPIPFAPSTPRTSPLRISPPSTVSENCSNAFVIAGNSSSTSRFTSEACARVSNVTAYVLNLTFSSGRKPSRYWLIPTRTPFG
ncbi:hypothetical protein DSECCO2_464660 [anaerobic digester metagenome]